MLLNINFVCSHFTEVGKGSESFQEESRDFPASQCGVRQCSKGRQVSVAVGVMALSTVKWH